MRVIKKSVQSLISYTEEFVEEGKKFMTDIMIHCRKCMNDWEEYLLNTNRVKIPEIFLPICDGNFSDLLAKLSNKNSKFIKECNDIEIIIESAMDNLKESEFHLSMRFDEFEKSRSQNFVSICFWLADFQISKSILNEISALKSFRSATTDLNNHLNKLEKIKISSIKSTYKHLGMIFRSLSAYSIPQYQPQVFLQSLDLNLDFSFKNTPEDFVYVKGIVYMRFGEFKQWKGYYSVATVDKFIHFFLKDSEIDTELSLDLRKFSLVFNIDNDEYFMKATSFDKSILFRFSNYKSYESWRRNLI